MDVPDVSVALLVLEELLVLELVELLLEALEVERVPSSFSAAEFALLIQFWTSSAEL